MAGSILSDYGPDRKDSSGRTVCGGVTEAKPLPYSPPVGPKGQDRKVGLGGTNYGNCGTQGKR